MDERRRQNLYWTLSEDYNYNYPGQGDFYATALEGRIHRDLGRTEFESRLAGAYGQYSHFPEIRAMAYLMAGMALREALLEDRPGLRTYEGDHFRDLEDYYHRHDPKNLIESLYFTQARDYLGLPQISGRMVDGLYKDLSQAKDLKDPGGVYGLLEAILDKHFHINPSLEGLQPDKDHPQELENQEAKKKKEEKREVPKEEKKVLSPIDLGQAQSAEFTSINLEDIDLDKAQDPGLVLGTPADDEKNKQVARRCGINALKPAEKLRLEKAISTGIHQGVEVHLSKGDYMEDMDSRYFEDMEKDQRRRAEQAFEKNRHIYNRMIFELKQLVQKNLIEDQRVSDYQAKTGEVDPSRIWRYEVLGDDNVFRKSFLDEEASFTVDILLDMSGSQIDRQEEVAIQGYIITEALQSLKIPTRVMGYQNLFHLQVIRLFRDYHDGARKNKDIFNYKAGGSNRDGMALRYVFETMDRDPETNILIVLSDGKPNDILYASVTGAKAQVADYEGEEAVYDTASEILRGKLSNIAILGVFTGEEEDIDQERLIFGSDFVWTKEVSRFSSLVGKYLKSLVKRIS